MQAWGSFDHKTFVTLIRQTIHNSGHASSVRILLLELLFRPARLREHWVTLHTLQVGLTC